MSKLEEESAKPRLGWTGHLVTIIVAYMAIQGASCSYTKAQKDRLADESYVRREARYQKLVATVSSFRSGNLDCTGRTAFLRELDQCWLYCSDEAIRAAKKWLDMAKPKREDTDDDRAVALGEFMFIVRKDLLSRKPVGETTQLRANEFELLYVIDCESELNRSRTANPAVLSGDRVSLLK